jgi:CheY-like chemotaxis protein
MSKTKNTKNTDETKKHYGDDTISTNIAANILLVEDIPTNQFIMRAILQDLGCIVELVSNGEIAVEKVKAHHYDAILMDCHMPVMDGYEATKKIRKLDIKQPYIIALTANTQKEDEDECRACGMDDFLSKPLDIEKLSRILHQECLS